MDNRFVAGTERGQLRLAFARAPQTVLKTVLAVEAVQLPGHIALGVIPDVDVESIGVEDDWALSEFLFKAVGIQLGFRAALLRIVCRFLRLDYGERLAAAIKEHVVGISDAGIRWLAWDFDLLAHFRRRTHAGGHIPTRLNKQLVDEELACFLLVEMKDADGPIGLREDLPLFLKRLFSVGGLDAGRFELLQELMHLPYPPKASACR